MATTPNQTIIADTASAEVQPKPIQQIEKMPEQQSKLMNTIVKEVSQNAFVNNKNHGLPLQLNADGEEETIDSHGNKKKVSKKSSQMTGSMHSLSGYDKNHEIAASNFLSSDPNKLDIINNLNSMKLISISQQFEMYPNEEVDIDQFVHIMVEVLFDTQLKNREDVIQQLVDLFHRSNKSSSETIQFEDLTSYLIEHEIQQFQIGMATDMCYMESEIQDKTTHNNYIEKIFYFQQIDKVILYESNMRMMRIYDALTMKNDGDISCPNIILAIEFAPDKNAICVSLSDRTIVFFDTSSANLKIVRKLHVPSTQKCLCYVRRKRMLVSAGTDGAIFAWNLDEIFSNEFLESEAQREKEKVKDFAWTNYVAENTPWFVSDIILCVVDLPNINQLATGSYDYIISLWDLRSSQADKEEENDRRAGNRIKQRRDRKNNDDSFPEDLVDDIAKTPSKKLQGHQKAIREIAYSERHKIIVSCGFDFEVFVWNPYLDISIMKLDGHEQPLVGVNCISNLNCFITCDSQGVIKVWNILDYSCMQTLYFTNVNKVTCLRAVPKHRRLICGSREFKVFEYTKPFIPELSDDNPITVAKYSPIRFEFYIAGDKSVKIWSAKDGKPVRVLKNIFDSDITAMQFDHDHRKLIVGSHLGKVKVFDIQSGVMTHEVHGHDKEGEGEISYIGYGGQDNTIITCGWDNVIQIHMDERQEHKPAEEKVLRGKDKCHRKDIISGDYAHKLGLIATGSRDHTVRIWDYERVQLSHEFTDHKAEVTIVKFLHPLPLLLTSDLNGVTYIWYTKPHEKAHQLIVQWRAVHSLEKTCPLTAVDSYYDPVEHRLLLLFGDEMGKIIVQDCARLLEHDPNIKPFDLTQQPKRNPWRVFPVHQSGETSKVESKSPEGYISDESDDENATTQTNQFNENFLQQIAQMDGEDGHTDVIRSIQYISDTDTPLIFTASLDRLAKIWNLKTQKCVGTLRQGYMLRPNYEWNFNLDSFDTKTEDRKEKVVHMLKNMRSKRDNEMSIAKKQQIIEATNKHRSLMGSSGAAMFGLSNPDLSAPFKPVQQNQNAHATSRDVFGGQKSMGNTVASSAYQTFSQSIGNNSMPTNSKHSKILDRAKRMVAYNNRQSIKTGGQGLQENKPMSQPSPFQSNAQNVLMNQIISEEEKEKASRAIDLKSTDFELDEEIDTEILRSEKVQEDLDEIQLYLNKVQESSNTAKILKSYGRPRRHKKR